MTKSPPEDRAREPALQRSLAVLTERLRPDDPPRSVKLDERLSITLDTDGLRFVAARPILDAAATDHLLDARERVAGLALARTMFRREGAISATENFPRAKRKQPARTQPVIPRGCFPTVLRKISQRQFSAYQAGRTPSHRALKSRVMR